MSRKSEPGLSQPDRGRGHGQADRPVRDYVAAGGVVINEAGDRVLILVRPGRLRPDGLAEVRLPKGHVETGELHLQTASREVSEETGLSNLKPLADLGHQRVEYDWQGTRFARSEHYFLFGVTSATQQSSPEHQFESIWLTWEEAYDRITFEEEREWLRRARSAHRGSQ